MMISVQKMHTEVGCQKVVTIVTYGLLNFAFQKRLAKEARFQETQAKNAAVGKKVKAPTAVKPIKSREASYYRVTCKVKTYTFLPLPCVFFSVTSFH